MSKIVKTWDGHQGELLYIKGKIAFIKESNGEVWFCLKTDIIDFDEINMEEYYVKDAGKITYIYGVDLEEHKKVIENQQKRIAELEQDLEFTTKTANELIEIKHKLEQELAELKEKLSKATQFETPHIERFAIVRYLAQKNEPYKIVNCYDCYRDKDYKIHYCFYNVKSMNFKLIEVFDTKQEAQEKLKEIQGNE